MGLAKGRVGGLSFVWKWLLKVRYKLVHSNSEGGAYLLFDRQGGRVRFLPTFIYAAVPVYLVCSWNLSPPLKASDVYAYCGMEMSHR